MNGDDLKLVVGDNLKRARKHLKLSYRELADICGIAGPNICRYEKGKHWMRIDTIATFATALGRSPLWFFVDRR